MLGTFVTYRSVGFPSEGGSPAMLGLPAPAEWGLQGVENIHIQRGTMENVSAGC